MAEGMFVDFLDRLKENTTHIHDDNFYNFIKNPNINFDSIIDICMDAHKLYYKKTKKRIDEDYVESNFDTLIRHNIVNFNSFIVGFNINHKYKKQVSERLRKEIFIGTLCNLDVLVDDYNTLYLVLCALLYECLPPYYYTKSFALYKFPDIENLHIINALQMHYNNTKNDTYVNLINLIIRSNSNTYKYMIHKIKGCYIKTSVVYYRSYLVNEELDEHAVYVDVAGERYKHPFVNQAYSLLPVINKRIYIDIKGVFFRRYRLDIDKIHKRIIDVTKLNDYENIIAKLLHVANFKRCINKK